MQEVLGDIVYVNVLIYIDDVLVYDESVEELLVAIENVFDRLRHFGIFLKPKKWSYMHVRLFGAATL